MPKSLLECPQLLERGTRLVELPARDARVDEQLESGRSLDPTCVRELAQEALHQFDGPKGVASIEGEPGAAEPCLADKAGLVEELRCLGRTSLPTSQLRELEEWRSGPGRAGATEVVRRGLELGLGLRPPAAPQLDGPVVGSTEGEHVAAAVPLGELGDAVGPFDRPHVVVHRGAGRHEDAEGPGVGDRDRRLVLEGDGGRLVETAHSLVHVTGRDQRRTVEREAEHLEVLDLETAPELDRGGGQLARSRAVTLRVREVPLVEREPAVIGPGLERLEQALGAREPPACDRGGAVELGLIDRQPRGHAGRIGRVAARPVQAKGALSRLEYDIRIVEPPCRPAEPLACLGRLLDREHLFERLPCSRPSRVRQRRPAGLDWIGGDVPGGPRHTGHCRARLR